MQVRRVPGAVAAPSRLSLCTRTPACSWLAAEGFLRLDVEETHTSDKLGHSGKHTARAPSTENTQPVKTWSDLSRRRASVQEEGGGRLSCRRKPESEGVCGWRNILDAAMGTAVSWRVKREPSRMEKTPTEQEV